MDTDEDWVEEDAVPLNLRAKILALKVCRNRCLAHADSQMAVEIAQPVIRMFSTVLQHEGSFSPNAKDRYDTQANVHEDYIDLMWIVSKLSPE